MSGPITYFFAAITVSVGTHVFSQLVGSHVFCWVDSKQYQEGSFFELGGQPIVAEPLSRIPVEHIGLTELSPGKLHHHPSSFISTFSVIISYPNRDNRHPPTPCSASGIVWAATNMSFQTMIT